ncbi:divalent metal cation transporter [Parahaliea mediterranea]|uniref:Divalent metal cation transporter n=2 Tax=Parahaliea mediterranea TaxID=651086 RepID=A0A939DCK0_9GAMM|nr:divalent metal cation transporter [Parahaliea mediterranea]
MRTIVGPTAVIAAGTMGAGAVASFLLAGAWFRYDLLWVILLMLPVFVVSTDTASRIGFLNAREGMFSLIRRQVHPGVAWFLLLVNVPVHFLIVMGQMSVMTSALMSVFGFHPPGVEAGADYVQGYRVAEIVLSLVCGAAILWLVLAQGYERMQKAMSLLMVLMFICFLTVALRGLSELPDILAGFIPQMPDDLPRSGGAEPRVATSSIIAMVGAAIAPAALLGMPYLRADDDSPDRDLGRDLRNSVVNLGVIFGAYAIFIVIAGGFALHPLANHAEIEAVHQASGVLQGAFPEALAFAGPTIFSLGVFMAAVTTLVVAAQLSVYFSLDMLGRNWRFTTDNRLYHRVLIAFVMGAAALAPFWSFPALLKVILLMGINVVVIPLVFVIVIYLVNRRSVVGGHTAEWWRNALLAAGLATSIALAVDKVPHYLSLLLP